MTQQLLIAAVFDFDGGEIAPEISRKVLTSLEPVQGGRCDGWTSGAAFLAVRHASADADQVAAAWQPAQSPDRTVTLMAGRLQEREDAIRALDLPHAASDAAIYAAAFLKWGEACDLKLLGDYAALQWQADARKVRLSRSPTGLNPLHVWRDGARLVVASLPRSLFAAGLDPVINQDKLADSLLLNFREGRSSWYRGAYRIEAGTVEYHGRAGSRSQRYWSLHDGPAIRFTRDEDYVEAVVAQFQRATKAEMPGVQNPAIMLSGGLDSQGVTSFLVPELPPQANLHSFTATPQAGWEEPHKPYSFGDEAPHVRALAALYPQLSTQFVTGENRALGQDMAESVRLGGWPIRNETNLHWIHQAHAEARELGCDAMFWGAAGNSGFSYDGATGYGSWLARGKWGRLLRELRAVQGDERSLSRKFLGLALMPNMPGALQRAVQVRRGRMQSPFASWCPMHARYAESSGALDRARAQGFDPWFSDTASSRDWRAEVLGDLLNEGGEIELAFRLQYGIPMRDPTLFRPLVELTAGIPDEQYLRDGTDRWLARRVLDGRIPDSVRTERRTGRQSPDWAIRFVKERENLAQELRELRADSRLAEVFDCDRLIRDFDAWPGTEDSAGVWKQKINAAVGRALSTARFVRYVESGHVVA